MKRILLITGFATLFAAGTASAQTSVQLSFGFGVPRPYVSGEVLVGRPHLRPVYRPYFYRPYFHRRFYGRPFVLLREPRRVIVVERERRGHFEHRHGHDDDRD